MAASVLSLSGTCRVSACVYGECMLVFGGTGVPFGDTASNELHVCNLRTLEWRRLECDGALPIRSYGHVSSHYVRSGERAMPAGGVAVLISVVG